MTPVVTHTSRRDLRCMSRHRHAVTHADVTPCVTVPPTRPDPTRKYFRGYLSLQTNASYRASRFIGLAIR